MKSARRGVIAAGAAGHHGDGVVGGHAAVGVEPVEADPGRGAQRGVELGGRDHGVGGEHDQHRGQLRGEHAGALGHPADRPAVALDDDLLADRVGGHDRLGGVGAAVGGRAPRTRRRRRPSRLLARVGQADQAGRADDDVDRADAELLGDPLGDRVGGLEALGAGVAVGAAGVEHDGADDAVLDDLLAPQDRVGLAAVGGEDGGGVEASGPWLTTRATSLPPVVLRPAGTPAATKPAGWVTVMTCSSCSVPSRRSLLLGDDGDGGGDGVPRSSPRLGRVVRLADRDQDPVGVEGGDGEDADLGLGERRQQRAEHAGEREVERALHRERGERLLAAGPSSARCASAQTSDGLGARWR